MFGFSDVNVWVSMVSLWQALPQPRGMLLDLQVFGDTSTGYGAALHRAFDDFVLWRKRNKIQCSQKRFSEKSLVRPTSYGWYLNAKGFNARVVSEWLMDKVVEVNAGGLQGLSPLEQQRWEVCESALKLAGRSGF